MLLCVLVVDMLPTCNDVDMPWRERRCTFCAVVGVAMSTERRASRFLLPTCNKKAEGVKKKHTVYRYNQKIKAVVKVESTFIFYISLDKTCHECEFYLHMLMCIKWTI